MCCAGLVSEKKKGVGDFGLKLADAGVGFLVWLMRKYRKRNEKWSFEFKKGKWRNQA